MAREIHVLPHNGRWCALGRRRQCGGGAPGARRRARALIRILCVSSRIRPRWPTRTAAIGSVPHPPPAGRHAASHQRTVDRPLGPRRGARPEAQGSTSVVLCADGRWRGAHGEGLGYPSSGRWVVGSVGNSRRSARGRPCCVQGSVWPTGSWTPPGLAADAGDVLVLFDAGGGTNRAAHANAVTFRSEHGYTSPWS
jgi:hypothetical protein